MQQLKKHFARRKIGPVYKYFPETTDAHDHWKHTGVCSECNCRAISVGRCAQCGHDMQFHHHIPRTREE